jgi:cytochrome c biogenesis protein CcdA
LFAAGKTKGEMLKLGLLYILAVYITYFLAGLGLIYFITTIPIKIAEYISMAVAVLVVGGGLIEIKDYFWYGQGFSLQIPPERAKQIHEYVEKITVPGIMFLGAFVAAVELPCTGGPYLAITLILAQNFNLAALLLLMFYNVIFVAPLVIILFMVYLGTKVQDIQRWKQDNRGTMRFWIGVVLILLGWLLLLIANGTINLA